MDDSTPARITPIDGARAVTDADFPTNGTVAEQAAFMINWAVLAPSVLNTQPWRFEVADGTVSVVADRSRQLRYLDPKGRGLGISLGAAVFNLRMAMRHYGFAVTVERVPDPERPSLVARVTMGAPSTALEFEDVLFRAIKRRKTSRHPFADMGIPGAVQDALVEAAKEQGVILHVITATNQVESVADLVSDAIRAAGSDSDLRDELDAWLRPNRDPRADGVPDEVQGAWDRMSYLGTDANLLARKTKTLAKESPALLLLSTERDDLESWIRAGEALEHILLLATHHDMAASYLNQPTEVPHLRKELAAVVGAGHPQVLFRVGYVTDLGGTPRRSVLDVID